MEARRAATTGGAASYVRISVTYVASSAAGSYDPSAAPKHAASSAGDAKTAPTRSASSPHRRPSARERADPAERAGGCGGPSSPAACPTRTALPRK